MEDCGLKVENSVVNRYVKSLYEVSVSLKAEKQISDEIKLLQSSVSALDDYKKYLKKVSLIKKYGENFVEHLKECLSLSKPTENFLLLLVKNKRLSLLIEICDEYLSFLDRMRGKKVFFVTCASDFSETDRKRLTDNLHEVFDGDIECVVRKDPSLIGGVKVQFRSKILDYSVKSGLARLYRAIKGDVYEN
jgi:F-type H+-transporting ATPase subunit delta